VLYHLLNLLLCHIDGATWNERVRPATSGIEPARRRTANGVLWPAMGAAPAPARSPAALLTIRSTTNRTTTMYSRIKSEHLDILATSLSFGCLAFPAIFMPILTFPITNGSLSMKLFQYCYQLNNQTSFKCSPPQIGYKIGEFKFFISLHPTFLSSVN
jgi:hypothetical protein